MGTVYFTAGVGVGCWRQVRGLCGNMNDQLTDEFKSRCEIEEPFDQFVLSFSDHRTITATTTVSFSRAPLNDACSTTLAAVPRDATAACYDTIRWVILTCAKKLTSSQLRLPHGTKQKVVMKKLKTTRMWANAQRDGRHAEYRRRPLFNAAKFG